MRHNVLIVEDDQPLLGFLRTLFARTDDELELVTARDGDEAIHALEQRPFDVVLLDLMMPRRSGFDVLEFLQTHRPEQLRVVLAMTAAADLFSERLDPGTIHGIVKKPFDNAALVSLVRHIIQTAHE
jgi:DNA-binding NtrC family response regulator